MQRRPNTIFEGVFGSDGTSASACGSPEWDCGCSRGRDAKEHRNHSHAAALPLGLSLSLGSYRARAQTVGSASRSNLNSRRPHSLHSAALLSARSHCVFALRRPLGLGLGLGVALGAGTSGKHARAPPTPLASHTPVQCRSSHNSPATPDHTLTCPARRSLLQSALDDTCSSLELFGYRQSEYCAALYTICCIAGLYFRVRKTHVFRIAFDILTDSLITERDIKSHSFCIIVFFALSCGLSVTAYSVSLEEKRMFAAGE